MDRIHVAIRRIRKSQAISSMSLARHTSLDTIIEMKSPEQLPKIDLCIVDPIYVLDRGDSFDENNAHCVTRLITALEQLTTEQDSALGLVHHTRKGNLNNADSMDRASGSSAFSRYPSVIMNLSRHEVEDCAIIEFTTRNFKTPKPICYQLDAPLETKSSTRCRNAASSIPFWRQRMNHSCLLIA